jgi:hypothetical protein
MGRKMPWGAQNNRGNQPGVVLARETPAAVANGPFSARAKGLIVSFLVEAEQQQQTMRFATKSLPCTSNTASWP